MRKAALILLIFFNACLMIGFLAGTALGGTASAREGDPTPEGQAAPRSAAAQEAALTEDQPPVEEQSAVPAEQAAEDQPAVEDQPAALQQPAVEDQADDMALNVEAQAEAPAPEQPAQATDPVQPPAAYTATESPTGQRSILFVGVDNLNAAAPVVKSIWMLFYIPSSPGLTLAPVFPAMTNDQTQADGALAAAFSMNADGSPSTRFATALIDRDIRWNHYAILDQAGLAALIDALGGVDLGPSRLGGQDVVSYLGAMETDVATNLESQAALIKSLCVIPGRPEVRIDILALFDLLNNHVHTNMSPGWIATDWQSLGLAGGQLCKFPTLRSSY